MAGGKASTHKITIARRRETALRLRLEGLDYREIAARMQPEYPSYTFSSAWRDVTYLMAEQLKKNAELAEHVCQLEMNRLDALLNAVWARAMQGSVEHINAVLRVMERRARLLGLDAPVKSDVTTDIRRVVIEYVNDWRNTSAISTSWPDDSPPALAADYGAERGAALAQDDAGNGADD